MEKKRQNLVGLGFLVLLTILFEGVLRKWVFHGYPRALFFVRDPFVLAFYIYAFYNNFLPQRGLLFYTTSFFILVITIVSFIQTVFSHLPWWIIAYSWRTHFFMIPFALLMGNILSKDDIKRIFSFVMHLTPVYAVLVYFQSINPRAHWINAGFSGYFAPLDAAQLIIRTEGFFTSSVGNAIFVGFLFAIVLSLWMDRKLKSQFHSGNLIAYSLLSCLILAVCGQRTTFLLIGVVFFTGLISSLVSIHCFKSFFKVSILALLFGSFLMFFVFPVHFNAIFTRFSTPSSEGIPGLEPVERIIRELTNFYTVYINIIPPTGLGLGYSSNAAYMYNISVVDLSSETEWGKHIVELGHYFGFMTIAFRVFLFFYLGMIVAKSVLISKSTVAALFYGVLAPFLLFGQLTGNGIASGFIWYLTGVVLALVRIETQEANCVSPASL